MMKQGKNLPIHAMCPQKNVIGAYRDATLFFSFTESVRLGKCIKEKYSINRIIY